MTVLKACIVCGRPSPSSRCADHKPINRRRQRMVMSGGAWETLRRKVIARDMGCCYLCDQVIEDGDEVEVDHLVEVAEGGGNDPANLATSHRACHARRHREPEWAAQRVERALRMLARVAPPQEYSGAIRDHEGAPWGGAEGSET